MHEMSNLFTEKKKNKKYFNMKIFTQHAKRIKFVVIISDRFCSFNIWVVIYSNKNFDCD